MSGRDFLVVPDVGAPWVLYMLKDRQVVRVPPSYPHVAIGRTIYLQSMRLARDGRIKRSDEA